MKNQLKIGDRVRAAKVPAYMEARGVSKGMLGTVRGGGGNEYSVRFDGLDFDLILSVREIRAA